MHNLVCQGLQWISGVEKQAYVPKDCSACSKNLSTRTVCMTETSENPVDSKLGCSTLETTQGSISTKCACYKGIGKEGIWYK